MFALLLGCSGPILGGEVKRAPGAIHSTLFLSPPETTLHIIIHHLVLPGTIPFHLSSSRVYLSTTSRPFLPIPRLHITDFPSRHPTFFTSLILIILCILTVFPDNILFIPTNLILHTQTWLPSGHQKMTSS